MKMQGYDKTQDGQRIDNNRDKGTLTGNWEIHYHGCYWEYKRDKPKIINTHAGDIGWFIGEYPNS